MGSLMMGGVRRKIRLIEGNAKCRHLKKLTWKGLCGRCLSVWGPELHTPPPLTPCKRVYSILIHTGKGGKGGEFNQTVGKRGSFTVPASRNSTDQQAVPANFVQKLCQKFIQMKHTVAPDIAIPVNTIFTLIRSLVCITDNAKFERKRQKLLTGIWRTKGRYWVWKIIDKDEKRCELCKIWKDVFP